jgi:hypothetical protein
MSSAKSAISSSGFVLQQVKVLRIVDPALYVIVRQLEGIYVELDSSSGAPPASVSLAARSGAGTLWRNPAYTGDIGISHG